METWTKVSLILCCFGILKEFRPSEPFVTKYLANPPMNFTLKQVYTNIYPVGTYANMVLLIVVFLITDYLRYKPVIIIQGISGIVVFVLLIVCRELILVQIAEVFYGLFMACDVAYFTYIYAKVDKSHYQEVTGHTRAAYLIGRALSGILSQVLISSGHFTYYNLNFFTLGGITAATLWALLLPGVDKSVYFHRSSKNSDGPSETNSNSSQRYMDNTTEIDSIKIEKFKSFFKGCTFIWYDFTKAFSNHYVLKWSFWWALATCGYYQVLNYVQVLWEDVITESDSTLDSNLNGAVEAIYTVMSAVASFGCGKLILNWEKIGEIVLSLCSLLIGGVIYVMSQAKTIWVAYITYIIYTIIYHAMITIASSEVAKCLNPDSHGLIFGINTFIGLALQTILTMIVNSYLSLPSREQFLVYATYFTILGIIFALKAVVSWIKKKYFTQTLIIPSI